MLCNIEICPGRGSEVSVEVFLSTLRLLSLSILLPLIYLSFWFDVTPAGIS